MATTNQVLKARVERGAALLDAEEPGWAPRIDVPTLDMGDGRYCVLGQTYDSFDSGTSALNLRRRQRMQSHGFDAVGYDEYDRLLPLWREAIEARCGGSER